MKSAEQRGDFKEEVQMSFGRRMTERELCGSKKEDEFAEEIDWILRRIASYQARVLPVGLDYVGLTHSCVRK